MLWVMTTADKYEFPLCVERTAGELARRAGISEGGGKVNRIPREETGAARDRTKESEF